MRRGELTSRLKPVQQHEVVVGRADDVGTHHARQHSVIDASGLDQDGHSPLRRQKQTGKPFPLELGVQLVDVRLDAGLDGHHHPRPGSQPVMGDLRASRRVVQHPFDQLGEGLCRLGATS